MCKYCKNLDEDVTWLVDSSLRTKRNDNDASAVENVCGMPSLDLECYLIEGSLGIKVGVKDTDSHSVDLLWKRINIKYCPFCGRSFEA